MILNAFKCWIIQLDRNFKSVLFYSCSQFLLKYLQIQCIKYVVSDRSELSCDLHLLISLSLFACPKPIFCVDPKPRNQNSHDNIHKELPFPSQPVHNSLYPPVRSFLWMLVTGSFIFRWRACFHDILKFTYTLVRSFLQMLVAGSDIFGWRVLFHDNIKLFPSWRGTLLQWVNLSGLLWKYNIENSGIKVSLECSNIAILWDWEVFKEVAPLVSLYMTLSGDL